MTYEPSAKEIEAAIKGHGMLSNPKQMRLALIAAAEVRDEWRPISELQSDDDLVLAVTADGRMMIWRASLLSGNLARTANGTQPDHLQFPATHFRFLPSPPKD